LVTDSQVICTAALAFDVDSSQTGTTGSNVTQLFARMTTWQSLATWLLTVQDWIFAGGPRSVSGNLRQRGLATGAVKNNIW